MGGFLGQAHCLTSRDRKSVPRGNTEALHVFSVLCAGFVLGIELLLTFWAYQVFAVFRICGYVRRLEKQFKTSFGIHADSLVLSWDRCTAGMVDIQVPNGQRLVRRSLQAVSYAQPVSFFVLGGLGLLGLAAGAWETKGALIAVFVALALGLICIGLVMHGLHKWASGEGYTPHAGMRASPAMEDRTTAEGNGADDDSKSDE